MASAVLMRRVRRAAQRRDRRVDGMGTPSDWDLAPGSRLVCDDHMTDPAGQAPCLSCSRA